MLVALREHRTILIDTTDGLVGQLAILMELPVTRTTLTESHLLDVGYQQLNLMVGSLFHFVEQLLRFIVLHPHDMGEGEIIECLCPTRRIALRQLVSLAGERSGRIDIPVMIGIRKTIQLVHRLPIGR